MSRIAAILTLVIPSIAHAHPGHEHLHSAWTHHAFEGTLVALFVGAAGYVAYRLRQADTKNG